MGIEYYIPDGEQVESQEEVSLEDLLLTVPF
jgi:hypothetical protein